MRILAAIDNSSAARPVLETATTLSAVLGTVTEAVHVRENGVATAQQTARSAGVPIRIIEAKPLPFLIAELNEPDVLLAVVGARGSPADPRPTGRVATAIVEHAAKPVVVVAPEGATRSISPLERLLVPLDGSAAAAAAATRVRDLFGRSPVGVVIVHVFDAKTVPQFLDRAEHDLDVWAQEFAARLGGDGPTRVDLRAGRAGDQIVAAAAGEQAGLIVLGWSQNSSEGHAAVVREVLARSPVPVLLVPVEAKGPPALVRAALSRNRMNG